MPDIKIIVAIDDKNGIAIGQKLPWDLPTDRKHFRDSVYEDTVVLGWNTFATNNYRPYGIGDTILLTRKDREAVPGVWVVHDADDYFKKLTNDVWVAGGSEIYKIALQYATHLYITKVDGDFGADTFFPEFKNDFKLIHEDDPINENDITFRYQIWERK